MPQDEHSYTCWVSVPRPGVDGETIQFTIVHWYEHIWIEDVALIRNGRKVYGSCMIGSNERDHEILADIYIEIGDKPARAAADFVHPLWGKRIADLDIRERQLAEWEQSRKW
jgi:hypothetical protein